MTDYRREYERWLTDPAFDEETKKELAALTDEEEIEKRFYKDLTFGTGGLRGIMGAGTNRMNEYTVGRATQGLANFINAQTRNGSVVIAYDSRRRSKEFAVETACVLAGNGITAYLFRDLRPTPELSFAVRDLNATAGVVITASHNPPQYNGYKVYWSDGGQIVPPYDKLIISEVNRVTMDAIKKIPQEEAVLRGLLKFLDKDMDDRFLAAVKDTVIERDCIKKHAKDLKIVYTPLNGTGYLPVTRVLKELGFLNLWTVPEQSEPDGAFPTLPHPNPEDPSAFRLALELAKERSADLVLATDPDADRLGVYAKDSDGSYMPFTGNMTGLVLLEYELARRKERGILPANGAVATTVVSSDMAGAIAKEYGVACIETLTGFKYIGEQIRLFEEAKAQGKPTHEFIFGFEESYGCLAGTHARDKDAVTAVAKLCEAAAFYRSEGMTLCDAMRGLYRKYGYYAEGLKSVALEDAGGAVKMKGLMNELRTAPPQSFGGRRVLALRDYESGVRTDVVTGEKSALTLPKSNVLYFELENGWCCVRPSGTEPKIKFYCGVREAGSHAASDGLQAAVRGVEILLQDMADICRN